MKEEPIEISDAIWRSDWPFTTKPGAQFMGFMPFDSKGRDALDYLYDKHYRGHPLRIIRPWWYGIEVRLEHLWYRLTNAL